MHLVFPTQNPVFPPVPKLIGVGREEYGHKVELYPGLPHLHMHWHMEIGGIFDTLEDCLLSLPRQRDILCAKGTPGAPDDEHLEAEMSRQNSLRDFNLHCNAKQPLF
ncbi:hypothetical protein E2C01_043124 [Portunus trituberculatus]|uniref:Uncharacterized protein n=1 Tax=Portunus trituberculatus TaxID=210409 RepID=A0A5B7FUU5_PORTR|nr:hypothetical protein [Portunus trituberculatus]